MADNPPSSKSKGGDRSYFRRISDKAKTLLNQTSRPESSQSHDEITSANDTSSDVPRSWVGLKAALEMLYNTAKVFPPLQSVVGSLISCIELVQVGARG